MKIVIAVISAIVIAILLITCFEYLGTTFYPFPKDFDYHNKLLMQEYMSVMPLYIFIFLLFGYAVSSYVGGIVLKIIAPESKRKSPIIAGCMLTVAAAINLYNLPHPLWFMIVNILIYIPFFVAGHSTVQPIPRKNM
jgi:hypothetical protein